MSRSEADRALQEKVRRLATEELRPRARGADRTARFPEESWDALAAHGFTGVGVPAEYGGLDLETTAYATLNEEVAYGSLAVATALSVHALATRCIADHAGATLREEWLPEMATGRPVGAFALSEPNAGSNPGEMATVAERDGNAFRLTGQKQWITNGQRAGVYVVFAKTDRSDPGTITQFLVPSDTPGITVGSPEDKLGLRASDTTPVEFDGVRIPAEFQLTPVGEGLKAAYRSLNTGRIGIGAQAVGLAQAAFDETIEHVARDDRDGSPTADVQSVRHRLASMATEIEAARELVRSAAARRDTGADVRRWASMAKYFASRTAMSVTNDAVQLHGDAGYLTDNDVERFYRDAKVTEIYEGTTQIQQTIIADTLFDEHGAT